jgi:hypothetical protein
MPADVRRDLLGAYFPSLDDAPDELDWLRFRFGYGFNWFSYDFMFRFCYRLNTTSPYQILHLLHPVLGYAHYYSLRAIFWFSASTKPIPAVSLLHMFLLYALHISPHLILLHNSLTYVT